MVKKTYSKKRANKRACVRYNTTFTHEIERWHMRPFLTEAMFGLTCVISCFRTGMLAMRTYIWG